MKATVALLVVISALLVATSCYAGDSQAATIARKWKAVQKMQEKNDQHLKQVEKDMDRAFEEPIDVRGGTARGSRSGSGQAR